MSKTNVFREGRVHVCSTLCDTCIFRPGNLMSLAPGRKDGMVAKAMKNGGVIPCHKTLDEKQQLVCRGFYEYAQAHGHAPLQIAKRLGFVTEKEV